MRTEYEMTIGIECHVQLATKTKLFSGSNNDATEAAPNEATGPIDFGLPGMLPVLNKEAVRLAVRAGKALNAEIAHLSRFDRKHYFYPDLPKGYQISQLYQPIILEGFVDVPQLDGTIKKVRIHHAHLEEDAGKLTHHATYSVVDLNRAGTPLIEIVSEPDIHSAAEAKAYATELYRLMTYAGVTNGDLYHGNMRFDVNISVAPKGSDTLGTRAEVKNLNSFRSVERAAEYEFERQVALLEKGETVIQETRGWDDATGKTSSQRSKENAQDYRYMPDPDIPPLVLSDAMITEMQAGMPRLPQEYRAAFSELNIDPTVLDALLLDQSLAAFIYSVYQQDAAAAKRAAFWVQLQSDQSVERVVAVPVSYVLELSKMVEENTVSATAAKEIWLACVAEPSSPRGIAEARNLVQVSDESVVQEHVDAVFNDPASAQSIKDVLAGNEKAIGYLVGQVMKRSQGKANPGLVQTLMRKMLNDHETAD